MPTMKDVAREAGVAQGTVSNVLNGRGNVSSEKIRLVEEAAARIGYVANRRARVLRSGRSNTLGVLLPNLDDKRYVDFYDSFKLHAMDTGYSVNLYLLSDDPSREPQLAELMRTEMIAGVATFGYQLPDQPNPYRAAGFLDNQILYIQNQHDGGGYIGFDYRRAGRELGEQIAKRNMKNVLLVTEDIQYSSQKSFFDAFMVAATVTSCNVTHIQTSAQRRHLQFLEVLGQDSNYDAVFFTNYGFAETFMNTIINFYPKFKKNIYTLSPLFTLPVRDYKSYELNYRLLGKHAAERLIAQCRHKNAELCNETLENDGLSDWTGGVHISGERKHLNVLTLDSPTARAMESITHLYTEHSNVEVKIAISSYDSVSESLPELGESSSFDVLRLHHTWMPTFGDRVFYPLKELDPNIENLFTKFLPGLNKQFMAVDGVLYALPETLSAQILLYRKDLFENPTLQRLYKEQYKGELQPPQDFYEYNQVASFFTRSCNPDSPVIYGTTLALGSSSVAAAEFLTRYFSHTHTLFAPDGSLFPQAGIACRAMQELAEAAPFAPRRHSHWWLEAARQFAAGNTAMTMLYSNYASEILLEGAKVSNCIGCAPIPGGNPQIGGGSLGVCRGSQHKEEALDFIKWMCSEKVATAMTFLGGVSPCIRTYDNYEVVDTYPWLALSKDSIERSDTEAVPPHYPGHFDERGFNRILGSAVNNVISGIMTVEQAIAHAQAAYRRRFMPGQ